MPSGKTWHSQSVGRYTLVAALSFAHLINTGTQCGGSVLPAIISNAANISEYHLLVSFVLDIYYEMV